MLMQLKSIFSRCDCKTELEKAVKKQQEIEDGMSGLITALDDLKSKRKEKTCEYKALAR